VTLALVDSAHAEESSFYDLIGDTLEKAVYDFFIYFFCNID